MALKRAMCRQRSQSIIVSLPVITSLALLLAGAARASPEVAVRISPARCELRLGETRRLRAAVTGTRERDVRWEVVGEPGHDAGSVAEDGLYSAPTRCVTPATVKVRAVARARPDVFAEALI